MRSILSSIGIGAATVDTVFPSTTVTAGFRIAAGGERALDVTIEIPHETPVTSGDVQVRVDTGLDIDNAIDPDDTDRLSVEPDRDLATLLDAVDGLGFDLAGVQVLSAELVPFDTHCGFVQEFEYRPAGGEFAGTLDDVALLAHPTPGGVETRVRPPVAATPPVLCPATVSSSSLSPEPAGGRRRTVRTPPTCRGRPSESGRPVPRPGTRGTSRSSGRRRRSR
jgi:sporulation-control protein spo0M